MSGSESEWSRFPRLQLVVPQSVRDAQTVCLVVLSYISSLQVVREMLEPSVHISLLSWLQSPKAVVDVVKRIPPAVH